MSTLNLIRTFAPQIRQIVTPEQVMRQYAPTNPIKNGFALCVAHQEHTPSMRIGPHFAHCFGCGFHGDSLELAKRLLQADTFRSMVQLNSDFRLGLPLERKLTVRESMELNSAANRIAAERAALHADRMERFERKLDYEQALFAVQDIAKQYRPTDPDAPISPVYARSIALAEQLKYLIECEA